MKITHKTKFKELNKISYILSCSSRSLIEEVKRFDVPKEIKGILVRDFSTVEIGELLELWDVKDGKMLTELTAKIFLKQEKEGEIIDFDLKKLPNLPLIDFVRLQIHCEERVTYAANLFKSLQRKSENAQIQAIYDSISGDAYDMMSKYCELPWVKLDIKEAKKQSWVDVYMAFKRVTKDYDREFLKSKVKTE